MSYSQDMQVKVFGHRGCRGLMPENTLEAFQRAIDLGIDGIEWDVVVNKDKQLIISHEPYIDASYCLDPKGQEIKKTDEKKWNIYKMTTAEIKQFDCGSKDYSKFPEQKKTESTKPTLQEAFQKLKWKPIQILFEIKSVKKEYDIFQPKPEEYAVIIKNEIDNFIYKDQIIFMSFDAKMLEALHQLLPNSRYLYLTYLPLTSPSTFLKDLSFKPYALGMYYLTASKKHIQDAHAKDVKVFAWTVNKQTEADKLKRYNIDGLITDYPDRIK